jgi:catechol 2,3-dioxygenase-like lactoylglutathione lyase family enzyme
VSARLSRLAEEGVPRAKRSRSSATFQAAANIEISRTGSLQQPREAALTIEYGAPPTSGWAKLVCELLVDDIAASLSFWTKTLGFNIAYQRPEQGFAYLERPGGAQIMLCQRSGIWETAALEKPFGRGVMFQIAVDDLSTLLTSLAAADWPLYAGPREVWRRHGDREGGQKEIFVQDPNGYLVMIAQRVGERPLGGDP